jgi:DNA-3-methyladenine glycosylase II
LIKIRGIGVWSANIYLLMALRHPDIWPQGDLALNTAIYQVKRLRKKPTEKRLTNIASSWRPWRSVAARILWHYYISK